MLTRSPELMGRADSALLVVDVQSKLLAAIADHQELIWNIRRLIDAAKLLGIPVAGTEQYPQGLGSTVPELASRLGPMPSKRMFSCRECQAIFDSWQARNITKILVVGTETHVCVQQTVLDLLAAGFRLYVATDAVRSRFDTDYRVALKRMDSSGAVLTTTEAVMFEWCETASATEFKQISQLVRESAPRES